MLLKLTKKPTGAAGEVSFLWHALPKLEKQIGSYPDLSLVKHYKPAASLPLHRYIV